MSLKLSRNKVNCLASLITQHIERNEELDYMGDIGNIRYRIFHLLMDELRLFEQIEESARERMRTQKRNVPEGSREWEILFRKFVTEDLNNLRKFWD
ncbi:MAG: DUF507 family protein [Candidatus Aminicenantes bacterium]|nr:MAG: DUF507 family protein [Candidatus Aminicenantes bacterium]